MSTELSDSVIIKLVLNGNQQAYALLVNRYQQYVFTLVLRMVKSREEAEEVAQDVFIKAYRALASFNGESKFSTWLYTITHNTSLSFLRKKKVVIHSLDNETVMLEADSKDSGMEANLVEQKSKNQMLDKAIALLSTDDAHLISLFYKAEQSLDEIGQILGIESNAVKVRLFRARTRLREKLETNFKQELMDIR
ncbi:RNA polymerase sigma factor [Terrimonas rubra]|uniref:RNA polymerase sigma factor n=1 Tax=Terrimonas rubra TaxID=1035890 RepID=A0ABW6A9J2_9BACT